MLEASATVAVGLIAEAWLVMTCWTVFHCCQKGLRWLSLVEQNLRVMKRGRLDWVVRRGGSLSLRLDVSANPAQEIF